MAVQKQATKEKKKQLDNNMLVPVANNTYGVLYYKSPRTQMEWVFQNYGDEDVIELHELRTMAASYKRYFEDNWIRVLDEDVIEYLRLGRYYEKTLSPEEIEDLFNLPVSEIADIIDQASTNVKSIILAKAREKYAKSELTNVHIIEMLKEKFNTEIEIT